MAIKWKNSRLGNRFFLIGLATYIIYSILVYFVIYYGIPIIYRAYNADNLNNTVDRIIYNSRNREELEYQISLLQAKSNVMVIYEYNGNTYECSVTKSGCNEQRYFVKADDLEGIVGDRNDFIFIEKQVILDNKKIDMTFIAPLSSTSEVQNTLVWFLPIFGLLAMVMSLISAYLISKKFSNSIVKLSEDANKITDLDFNINQSIKSDDELGDLSNSLVKLASKLQDTLGDLQLANDELNDEIAKERRKEQERRSYIATLSHDLKTPLTAIKGQLEGMIYNVGKYKDHSLYLKKNLELTMQMENIIQSIIVSSKLDDYDVSINKQEINLLKLVENIVSEYDYQIENNMLQLNIDIKNDVLINVDYNLFTKALSNIIGNAILYSEVAEVINITYHENSLTISNKIKNFDTKLISESLIFKPFYRQDKSRNKQGSGLGMYIVKRVCDLHEINTNLNYEDEIFSISLEFKN